MKKNVKLITLVAVLGIGIAVVACSKDEKKTCNCKSVTHATGTGSEYVDDIVSNTTVTIDKGSCSDGNSTSSSSVMGMTVTTTMTCN